MQIASNRSVITAYEGKINSKKKKKLYALNEGGKYRKELNLSLFFSWLVAVARGF